MTHCVKKYVAGFIAGGLLLSANAWSQEFRIGFVSTDRIFKEAGTAKAAQTKLEQEFSKREKELVEQGAVHGGQVGARVSHLV